MHILTRTLLAVLLALSLVVGAGAATAGPGLGKYQNIDRALADGYVPIGGCVPGMGFHYAKFSLLGDDEVNVAEPEALVYANGPDGLELVAAEYIKVGNHFELLNTQSTLAPPGPAVHAWFFLPNPDGLTAPYNPRVGSTCDIEY